MDKVFDVAIIGGGINGCGCAADAAMRGLSVVLFEKDDLASKTSSSSTKLIHGGLRYLEQYHFTLVKKALKERQVLLRLAPHIIHPQAFILPQQKQMRPAWLLRLGLFFYDHLSRLNHLPRCKSVHRSNKSSYFTPLKKCFNRGFLFYDAATDDARLTIINALQANKYGASIRPRSTVKEVKVVNKLWQLEIQPEHGSSYTIHAKSLINAAGPWVQAVEKMTNKDSAQEMTLVKGSHIVVPQIYPEKQAYFLQHQDNRMLFVIPYHDYTMIGTTEVAFTGSLDKLQISEEETDYLITFVNSYFESPIHAKDIIFSWSGVRPLLAKSSSEFRTLSRDYSYHFQNHPAPLITIYGGKITTYRQLAEETINKLACVFPQMGPCITKQTPLPGAFIDKMDFTDYVQYAKQRYHWLDKELLHHYLYTYGTCMESFLASCTGIESLGTCFAKNLYQVEVDYLLKNEWARTVEDILCRRTKFILNADPKSYETLESHLKAWVLAEKSTQVTV